MAGLELVIRIPGDPVPQNVGKVGRWKSKDGREGTTMRQPPKVIAYKLECEERMYRAARDAKMPGDGAGQAAFGRDALEVTVLAVFACPKSEYKKRAPVARRPHTGPKDLDNLWKALGDAGKGVLWHDDGQVCRLSLEKWVGAQEESPYVEVRVRRFEREA